MKYTYQTFDTIHVSAVKFDISEMDDARTAVLKTMYDTLKCAFIVKPELLNEIKTNYYIPCVVSNIYADQGAPFDKTQAVYNPMLAMEYEYDEEGNTDPAVMYHNDYDDTLCILMSERCYEHFLASRG